ncbi:hypothetical protein [Alterisphingorhabdus coralli]|uniref:Pyridoxal phosphate biosynthetic protein n=1 Tax=Alterisphingorhabdus coralli TaxID=3071408 RepID=A0AA97F8A2_9SPHN|nr:hypothetical protein [Parasphingorhabdus sp. SCSIO 66989]WOE76001.1 hypothetical protein RB602_04590 [Parasphingorhabdus sp. SCSIO 66989]
MSETPPKPTTRDRLMMALAAIPFLVSIFVLGLALSNQVLVTFGIAWPVIQIVGYWMMLQSAEWRFSHQLVTTQIALHWLVMFLLIALVRKAL